MKNNNLDKFESMMQDALNSHQESFVPKGWDALEKRLPKAKAPLYKSPWLWGAAVIVSIAVPVVLSNVSSSKFEEQTSGLVDSKKQTNLNSSNDQLNLTNNEVPSTLNPESFNSETITIEGEGFSTTQSTIKTEENKPNNTSVNKPTTSETNTNSNSLTETNKNENVNPKGNENSGLSHTIGNGNGTVVKKPTAEFSISTKEICEGTSVFFTTEKQPEVDYLWSFGDGTYSKDQNPKHSYSQQGSYVVSLIVRSSVDNSILTKATDELVVVNPLPKVDFNFELKDNQGIPITSFINLTDKGYKWNWNTGDGNAYATKDPDHLYYRKGKYNVTLTVENEYGCSKAYTKPIDIKEDYNLLAPNSFTPNGDGINDYFIPEALRVMDVQFTMSIISISEGVIFETNSLSNPWNGNNQRTGSLCGEGTYKWVVSFVNEKGKTEQFTGAVLLLK
jgi:PKD repeat protein